MGAAGGEAAANLGNALLIWPIMGIDPEAGAYHPNVFEESGFTEHVGELVYGGAAVEDVGLAARRALGSTVLGTQTTVVIRFV